MTDLLKKAVASLSELPPERQNALAAMVLEEIADEPNADSALSIEELEEEARSEYLAGKTEPLRF